MPGRRGESTKARGRCSCVDGSPASGSVRVAARRGEGAGVAGGRDRLVSLAGEVRSRLTTIGVTLEARPFAPHMTLARVKDGTGLRPGSLLNGLTDIVLGRMTVDAITLFQSRLSPSGSSYRLIATSPLSGDAR